VLIPSHRHLRKSRNLWRHRAGTCARAMRGSFCHLGGTAVLIAFCPVGHGWIASACGIAEVGASCVISLRRSCSRTATSLLLPRLLSIVAPATSSRARSCDALSLHDDYHLYQRSSEPCHDQSRLISHLQPSLQPYGDQYPSFRQPPTEFAAGPRPVCISSATTATATHRTSHLCQPNSQPPQDRPPFRQPPTIELTAMLRPIITVASPVTSSRV